MAFLDNSLRIFARSSPARDEIKGQEKCRNVSLPLSLIPIIMLAGNVNLQSARRRANRERPTRFYHISFPCDNKFAPRAKITRLSRVEREY